MENKASITSLMSSFGRAYHTANEKNPVFADEVAKLLMTDDEYKNIGKYIISGIDFFAADKKSAFKDNDEAMRYIINTHIAPTPLCRASYCENALKTAVKTGTEQYVILGAGLDTFAFREKEFVKGHKIYEADHPKTQEDKLRRIQYAGLEIPENLKFVGVDFASDNLADKLDEVGFDRRKKTFFSWLGVSYYLTREQIENMLCSLSELACDGSTLLFDCADEKLFTAEEKRVANMLAMAAAGGEAMKSCFSYNELERLLEKYDFLIYEFLTPQDIQKQIIKNAEMTAFEHINYVQAVLKSK